MNKKHLTVEEYIKMNKKHLTFEELDWIGNVVMIAEFKVYDNYPSFKVYRLPDNWCKYFYNIKDETVIEFFNTIPKTCKNVFLPHQIINNMCCRFSANYEGTLYTELKRLYDFEIHTLI